MLLLFASCHTHRETVQTVRNDSLCLVALSDMEFGADSIVVARRYVTDSSVRIGERDREDRTSLRPGEEGGRLCIYRPRLSKRDTVFVSETKRDTVVSLRDSDCPVRQSPVLTWVNIGVAVLLLILLLMLIVRCRGVRLSY